MITEQDLQEAIAECKGQRNPNASTCIKLAAFLTIKRELYGEDGQQDMSPMYSYATPNSVEYDSGTEFSDAIKGIDFDKLLPVVDELMTTLQVLHPRLYDGVMIKVTS